MYVNKWHFYHIYMVLLLSNSIFPIVLTIFGLPKVHFSYSGYRGWTSPPRNQTWLQELHVILAQSIIWKKKQHGWKLGDRKKNNRNPFSKKRKNIYSSSQNHGSGKWWKMGPLMGLTTSMILQESVVDSFNPSEKYQSTNRILQGWTP